MAVSNTTNSVPTDGGPEIPDPLPSNPALPTFQDKPGATSTPTAKPTRTPRPQPSVSPSVSNPTPTPTPTKSVQFPTPHPTITMQPLGIGAGRSLPAPVGKPTTNVYHPATPQPILKSKLSKTTVTPKAGTPSPSPGPTAKNK
jgi:hypothetical protein